jgi:UDP-galactopyranose mutase
VHWDHRHGDHCDLRRNSWNRSGSSRTFRWTNPGPEPYTRKVEIKHVTRQSSARAIVVTEFPAAEDEPYYPVSMPESRHIYQKYQTIAETERTQRGVHFAGRLGTYSYINTDEAIAAARRLALELIGAAD